MAYFDASSAMPTRQEVIDEIVRYMGDDFGNPASIHGWGSAPKRGMERAREEIGHLINARPEEILFTSGATESINLALRGSLPHIEKVRRKVVTSAADHRSVTATASALANSGYEVIILEVDKYGVIDLGKADRVIGDDTALISIPFASSEVGSIQPYEEIAEMARRSGSLLHVDLTMAAFQEPMDVARIGMDLATLSSNDLLGPKGVGALYVRSGVKMTPVLRGGGQERGLRSGSENVAGIVGMGAAACICRERIGEVRDHLFELRDSLRRGLLQIEGSHLNGHPTHRLPNNLNIRFDYIEGESMLMLLDMNGIGVGTGSACSSKTLEASPTLLSMGLPHEKAHGSMQITLNPLNTGEEADHMVDVMPGIVSDLRAMSPLYNKEDRA